MNQRSLCIAAAVIIAISAVFRIVWLGHVPGVNGDEAWFGLSGIRLLEGDISALMTPNGRLANPFFVGLNAVVHVFRDPSFFTLRIPAVVSGLLLIVFSYVLLGSAFGRIVGLLATLLIATSPLNIAYARFSWGASQTALFCLFPIYFAFKRRWVPLVVALVALLLVHPANVFFLPVLLGILLGDVSSTGTLGSRRLWICVAMAALVIAVAGYATTNLYPELVARYLAGVEARLTDPTAAQRFIGNSARFLSGTTVFEYITGVGHYFTNWIYDLLVAGFLLAAPLLHAFRKHTPLTAQERGLGYGLLASALAFYLIAGNSSIESGHERYAMFLVVPTFLLVAIFAGKLSWRWRNRASWSVVAFSAAMLAVFYGNYFHVIRTTGGEAHGARQFRWTFMTGPEEPKAMAFRLILQDAAHQETDSIAIFADDYWVYWCVRYLSARRDNVRVGRFVGNTEPGRGELVYAVAYTGTRSDQRMRLSSEWEYLTGPPTQSFSGRDLLSTHRRVSLPVRDTLHP